MSMSAWSYIPILTCRECGRAKALDCFLLDEQICDPCHADAEEGSPMTTLTGKSMIKSLQKLALRLARSRIDTVDLYYVGRILRQLLAAVEQACEKNGIDLDADELPKATPVAEVEST